MMAVNNTEYLTPDITPHDFPLKNAFTVDVEEWYQVGAFETVFEQSAWPSLESRVVYQTEKLIDYLDELSVQGTFFCLGWVAERHPSLLRKISDRGHEIGCHGMEHGRLFTLTEAEVAEDISKAKSVIEDVVGNKVLGYRAPSFSLTPEIWWVYDLLKELGFDYSSSLYPVKTDHYGMENAPRTPFFPTGKDGILEIPLSVCDLPFKRFPASGGGYFRLFPYMLSKHLLRGAQKQSRSPSIFYMHPWEMDVDQPYVSTAPLLSRFRHYQGQAKLPTKLKKLAADFNWASMADAYAPYLLSEPT